MSGLSKRSFIKCSFTLLVSTLTATGCGILSVDLNTVAKHLVELLRHRDQANKLGKLYLTKHPTLQSETLADVTRVVLSTISLHEDDLSYFSLKKLEPLIAQRVRQDFTEENIVIVDGWMLSHTEASLCVIAYLSKSD